MALSLRCLPLVAAGLLAPVLPVFGQSADTDMSGPRLMIHGFADVSASRTSAGASPNGRSSLGFALGQFDLFWTAALAPRVSFLGESVFELNGQGEGVVDVERLLVKYSWSDRIRLAAGRSHTALGFWNEAYHHGTLLQPTIERPEAMKFEDDGGILPVHFVGLEASGALPIGGWSLNYVANLANGRGATPDLVQGTADANRHKALAAKLSFARSGDWRIHVGASTYQDRIPAEGTGPDYAESIVGAHLALQRRDFEWISEYYHIRHRARTGADRHYDHETAYAVIVGPGRRVRPYAAAERLSFAAGDPFYADRDTDLTRLVAGLRISVSATNVVKAEIRSERRPGRTGTVLAVQTAIGF